MGDPSAYANDASRARLVAIIGPGDSSITMQTHNILQLFEMPQIGYSATARQLSDKEKFKYFTRVIASDTQQAQAMVDIIRQFQWSYVATIGTEGCFFLSKCLERNFDRTFFVYVFGCDFFQEIMVAEVLKQFVHFYKVMLA